MRSIENEKLADIIMMIIDHMNDCEESIEYISMMDKESIIEIFDEGSDYLDEDDPVYSELMDRFNDACELIKRMDSFMNGIGAHKKEMI